MKQKIKYFKQDKANGEIKEVSAEDVLFVLLAGYTKKNPYNSSFSLFWEEEK